MAKVVGNKLRTLYIMKVLLERTDEKHRMSTSDLIKAVEEHGLQVERKSVYDDIETLKEYGLDIVYTKEKPAGYFIGSRDFELPELKILVDAVQASRFITSKKSKLLIEKLECLASEGEAKQLRRNVYVSNRVKSINENIFYNVDVIHMAIRENKKISFQYFNWNLDKELVPRNDGEAFVLSPWALIWSDENYYMLAYDEAAEIIKHYRVDKIKNCVITEDKRKGREAFDAIDMKKFTQKTFGMYGGKSERVTMEFENQLIGAVIDKFGTDIIVVKTDDEHFQVTHEVSVSGQFFGWMTGLGAGARIVAPRSAVDNYIIHLKSVYEGMNGSFDEK